MRGRASRPVEEADVDLTPMLDVVFILLIFFIVTAVFTKEQAIGLEPPPPPPPPNVIPPESPTILIYIDEDSLIRVNGRISDIGSVGANIERLKAESPESAVIIQADPRAKTGVIVNIRDQAAQANVDKVNLILSAN
ncbi:MAG: biopolymer transporter ExbD [Hyphomonadaceae bacterium]